MYLVYVLLIINVTTGSLNKTFLLANDVMVYYDFILII